MNAEMTLIAEIEHVAVIMMAVWGFFKVVKEIVKSITDRHDKEQKWDEMEERLVKNIQDERDKIYTNYDKQLQEIRQEIEQNHCENEAKMQEISAGMMILTKSVRAVLEGQMKQGLNGPVAEAKKALDDFIDDRAFD